jgi:YrbI family 3-deoxy-D-manno-octulosonate 8-phosphate phosphatase
MKKSRLIGLLKNIKFLVFDFDGVLTDNRVLIFDNGAEAVICDRSDGLGLIMAKEKGIELLVLSKERNCTVKIRCTRLGIPYLQAIDDKLKVLKQIAKNKNIVLSHIAYVGNDINDLECMKAVGLPIAVKDSYPQILKTAKYITKKHGGKGAVREVCDMIIKAKS